MAAITNFIGNATTAFTGYLELVNKYFSGYVLVVLLIGIGLFYTIRTGFVQFRCFGEGLKKVFGGFSLRGGKQSGGLSSFQALATAIAAQVGTGNIVGACGAILVGGPGAIFWMWIIALLGMATIYAEATLAQKTRVVNADGSVSGGPIYYIRHAFKGGFGKFLAGFFAVATILSLGFMGSMVQSNSIGGTVSNAIAQTTGFTHSFPLLGFDINTVAFIAGIVVVIIAAIILLGGVNRIASVTEKMVPIMAAVYIIGCLVVLAIRIEYIPETFKMIVEYAFNTKAVIGGGIGAAIMIALQNGAKRGLFSNEAGMGSTPHAHALAKVDRAHDQGVSAMIGVFIDTFVVLNLTAFVVISTLYAGGGIGGAGHLLNPDNYAAVGEGLANGGVIDNITYANDSLAQLAFSSAFGEIMGAKAGTIVGSIFVAVCLFFFAFSTILGWNLFGKLNFEYLTKKKGVIVFTIIALVFILIGSILKVGVVWELMDFFNYLMVIPNAIALFALSRLVVSSLKEGLEAKKAKKNSKK